MPFARASVQYLDQRPYTLSADLNSRHQALDVSQVLPTRNGFTAAFPLIAWL